jgi:uncharacterized phiE125 gp8 family phage protein
MTITNGYISLTEFKNWARITSTSSDDDTVCETLIESASRYIDTEAQRNFFTTSSDTRVYDLPEPGRDLLFDADFQTVTTVLNGDGSTIANTAYVLLPANVTPKYGLRLINSTGVVWKTKNGSPLQCISVTGTTGASCPTDIKEACLMIAKAAYNRRFGENMSSITTITAGGLIVTPEDVPAKALQMIWNHRRINFG